MQQIAAPLQQTGTEDLVIPLAKEDRALVIRLARRLQRTQVDAVLLLLRTAGEVLLDEAMNRSSQDANPQTS